MTNNKPEVVADIDMLRGQERRYASLRGDIDPYSLNDGDELIRLSDYEALQAEYEKLFKHLQNLIDQTTPLVPDPDRPEWSRRIQLDEVIAERDQLRAECEKLHKDTDKYRHLLETVQGEPVAYISHTSEGDILGWERQFDAPSHTPLYTAPQPAEQQLAPDMSGLTEALRQYQHNDGSGLVFGYDKLLVDRHVAELVEALEKANQYMQQTEVTIDHEWGECRDFPTLERHGDLHPYVVIVREALDAYRKQGDDT